MSFKPSAILAAEPEQTWETIIGGEPPNEAQNIEVPSKDGGEGHGETSAASCTLNIQSVDFRG